MAVCTSNGESVPSLPLRPDNVHKKAPKSEHMLTFLRAMLTVLSGARPDLQFDLHTVERGGGVVRHPVLATGCRAGPSASRVEYWRCEMFWSSD